MSMVPSMSVIQTYDGEKKENPTETNLVPRLPLPSRLIRSRGNICRCWFCRVTFFPPDSPHLRFSDEPVEEKEEEGEVDIYEDPTTDDETDILQQAVLCPACIARLQPEPEADGEEGEWDEVGEDEI